MNKDMKVAMANKSNARVSHNPQTTVKAQAMARGFAERAAAAKAQLK